MPHKNTLRFYIKNGHYHIYNRGVEKRKIFLDHSDYKYYLSLLESYTEPKVPVGTFSVKEARNKNIPYWRSKLEKDEIEIICFALMPNHFHFLFKQNSADAITRFMRRISNSYVKYFNKKYERVGSLFQGKFKSVLIESESYLLHLSRYIHLNPLEVRPLTISKEDWISSFTYSSYPAYLGKIKKSCVKTDTILSFFNRKKQTVLKLNEYNSYQNFVENYIKNPEEIPEELVLE